jgi:hypothetical protein
MRCCGIRARRSHGDPPTILSSLVSWDYSNPQPQGFVPYTLPFGLQTRCVINGAFIHISTSSFPGDVGRHREREREIKGDSTPGEITPKRSGDRTGEDPTVQRHQFLVGSMDCSRRSRRHDNQWPVE